MAEIWLKCSACKNPIAYGATHWVCSVSTCNRSRTRLVFCTVSCWDSHVAMLRHRDSWAVEARAPSREAWERELAANPPEPTPAPRAPIPAAPAARRVVGDASPVTAAAAEGVQLTDVADKDILIVVSKMKKYIKDRSGMNCSDAVAELLSDHVRAVCDDAIRVAARDDRKTVLDRDIPRVRR
jgi:histone H3/H4